jgi:uncharacterized ubiquitin-like protein YukD
MNLTDQTQDSTWYNALPVFAKYGVKLPSRKYFKALIKVVCEKLGVSREQLHGPPCIIMVSGQVLVLML